MNNEAVLRKIGYERKLRKICIGHILRDDSIVKLLTEDYVEGKRSRGMLRQAYVQQNLKHRMESFGELLPTILVLYTQK